MKFANIEVLNLFWLILLIGFFIIWARKRRKLLLEKYFQKDLLGSLELTDFKLRTTKQILFLLSLVLMVVSLARPQWGFKWQRVEAKGLDIVIALDTSKSMLAQDLKPNRLERAKLAIEEFVKNLKGDKVGLVVFTSVAFLQCPLTLDYGGFLLSLKKVNTNILPVGGTSLSGAIRESLKALKESPKKSRAIILITDGEDHEGKVVSAAEQAKKESTKIFCIGVGSPEGELILVKDEEGKRVFLKDREGKAIKTRLNEELLQKVALITGAAYIRSTPSQFGLDLLYNKKIAKIQKHLLKSKMVKKYEERYQIFLSLAFFLLLAELFIPERR